MSFTLSELLDKFALDGDHFRCTECGSQQHVSWGNDHEPGFVHKPDCSCTNPDSQVPERPWQTLVDVICKASSYSPAQQIDEAWNPVSLLHAHGDRRVPPLNLKTGEWLYVEVRSMSRQSYRWNPYKPNSQQFKHGFRGRWQAVGEYGGWDNAVLPENGEWIMSKDQD